MSQVRSFDQQFPACPEGKRRVTAFNLPETIFRVESSLSDSKHSLDTRSNRQTKRT